MSDRSPLACTFWGVRGSTPCPNRQHMKFGGNTTCLQIHLPATNEILIFDSGTGIRNLGQQIAEQRQTLSGHIFITHPHWDHIQGFPFFQPIHHADNQFEIHMPAQQDASCRDIMSGHFSTTFFPVSLDMMDADIRFVNQPPNRTAYKNFDIEFIRANHAIHTAIYKLHVGDRQLVFAPDNELVPGDYRDDAQQHRHMERIASFIEGADLLIHDAQYDLETYEHKQGWGHSPWRETVRMAMQCGVKKLVLTHHDPNADDRKLQQRDELLQKEYHPHFEMIQLAREGETVEI